MSHEPHEMTAAEISALYRDGDLSPVDVAEACLGRIEALDSEINSFCLVDRTAVIEAARASEERWTEGEPLSPLDGVPVAIKDLLITKGWPTRRGSLTVEPNGPWTEDAPCVARLREAGAVLIGKTTTPEFGWKGSTDSPLTGITRNPWNKAKTPGGSSGGSSAALAARFAPLAAGHGWRRLDPHSGKSCGCYGFKPSFGRVAAYPMSPFGTVAHVGPMSRTVRDSAMFLNVIGKPTFATGFRFRPTARTTPSVSGESMKGKRIAFSPRLGYVEKVAARSRSVGRGSRQALRGDGRAYRAGRSRSRRSGGNLPNAVVGRRRIPAGRSSGGKESATRSGSPSHGGGGQGAAAQGLSRCHGRTRRLWQQDAPVHGGISIFC